MDSRKFKKIDNNTPKNKRRKKHKNKNHHRSNEYQSIKHRNYQKIKYDEKPYKKEKHKKTEINYKTIISVAILLLILLAVIISTYNLVQKSTMDPDAELVKPVGFNLTPYGYKWNKELYGMCIAENENNTNSTYYFTLEQMAALASDSSNTFNYTDGLYLSYNTNNSDGVKIVQHIYKTNYKEIKKPENFDEYSYVTNARFLGRESPYCFEGFGFTQEEYKNSVFGNNT